MLDTVDFPVAFFGAIRGGVVALPLNILLTEAQYAYVMADSRACAIMVQAALAKPKIEWSKVEVPESDCSARITKFLKQALEQASRKA